MTRYTFHGDPNGNLNGVQGDQGFDIDTNPNNYFVCDAGSVWIAFNESGGPSGAWSGVVEAIPITNTIVQQTIVAPPLPVNAQNPPGLAQSSTNQVLVNCRIGMSGQLYDPNSTNPACIKWVTLSPKQLKCLSNLTPQQIASGNFVADNELRWDFLYKAKFLYLELSISGTGGDCRLSGIVANVDGEAIKY